MWESMLDLGTVEANSVERIKRCLIFTEILHYWIAFLCHMPNYNDFLCSLLYLVVRVFDLRNLLDLSSNFFILLFLCSNNINWVPLFGNCTCRSCVKCFRSLCLQTCSTVGTPLVFDCCQHVYHRHELQSYAKLCWILPSMDFTTASFLCLSIQ